jgi:hypothetical protein
MVLRMIPGEARASSVGFGQARRPGSCGDDAGCVGDGCRGRAIVSGLRCASTGRRRVPGTHRTLVTGRVATPSGDTAFIVLPSQGPQRKVGVTGRGKTSPEAVHTADCCCGHRACSPSNCVFGGPRWPSPFFRIRASSVLGFFRTGFFLCRLLCIGALSRSAGEYLACRCAPTSSRSDRTRAALHSRLDSWVANCRTLTDALPRRTSTGQTDNYEASRPYRRVVTL